MVKFYTVCDDGKSYFAPTLFGFECCSDDRCEYKEIKNAITSITRFGVADGFALVCRTDDLRWCVVEGFSSADDVDEFLEREGISEYFNRMYLCQLHTKNEWEEKRGMPSGYKEVLENDYEKRCSDCPCLVEDEDSDWYCDEYEKKCKDIDGLCGE